MELERETEDLYELFRKLLPIGTGKLIKPWNSLPEKIRDTLTYICKVHRQRVEMEFGRSLDERQQKQREIHCDDD